MGRHKDNLHPLHSPFVSKSDDGKYYVKVKTGEGEFHIMSNGYDYRPFAYAKLKAVREDMYHTWLLRD